MNFINRKRLLRRVVLHHVPLMAAVALSVWVLYVTRPYPDAISRASFATAYPALVLLAATLWLGPWNILRQTRLPVSIDLRRDIGIWAGILGLVHTGVGLCVHLRGRPWLYFIYGTNEGRHVFPVRHDLFGFANYTGALATIVLLILFATSNDYAIRTMSTPRWKQLQRWNYVLFVLVLLHAAAYQIIEKQHANFVITVAVCAALTLILQGLGFRIRRTAGSRKLSPV
jgi:sulfoxide reductase heme-binding subunit YedZ